MCLAKVSYERILAIQNLNDVQNPWKGVTMNRCIVLALVVLLVSSGVNELHGEYCNHHFTKQKHLTLTKVLADLFLCY